MKAKLEKVVLLYKFSEETIIKFNLGDLFKKTKHNSQYNKGIEEALKYIEDDNISFIYFFSIKLS